MQINSLPKKLVMFIFWIFCLSYTEVAQAQTDSIKIISPFSGKDSTVKLKADEKPATFPGGMNGWKSYLEANLHYPKKAQRKKTEGVVRVQLVVEKDGTVTNVKALNDPGDGLAEEAERVIKEGPNWKPAWQNGKHVTYRFVQTITFQLI